MQMVALETGFVGIDVDDPGSDESEAVGVADGETVVDQTAEGEDEAAADAEGGEAPAEEALSEEGTTEPVLEDEGPEPARMPTSLTATLREQGGRFPHRISRRTRRKGRGDRGPLPEGQRAPQGVPKAVPTAGRKSGRKRGRILAGTKSRCLRSATC
jgi:hypothetical protein